MKFVSTTIDSNSHALMFYRDVEQYAVKPLEYIDKDFEFITLKPEGNMRETYKTASDDKLFAYPLRFIAGQEPTTTRRDAHLIAIGDKSTLEELKSAYITVAIYTKIMQPNSAVSEALLHLAKNEPHNMSNSQLQALENQNTTPNALKNALKALQAENTANPAQHIFTCHMPHRKIKRFSGLDSWHHQGECQRITFKSKPSAPEFYWVGKEKYGALLVSATLEGVNRTLYDAKLVADLRNITLITFRGDERHIESMEIMPGICSAPTDTPLPRVYSVDSGKPCKSAP